MTVKRKPWPFPTKDAPLKPTTPAQERTYQQEQRSKLPEAPI